MARYALRAFGSPVFLSNMLIPKKRYALRAFGGPVLISGIAPLPDTNVTLYVREGNSTAYTREGNVTVYER